MNGQMELPPTPETTPSTTLRPFACPACSSRFTRLYIESQIIDRFRALTVTYHFREGYDLRKRHVKKSHRPEKYSQSPTETDHGSEQRSKDVTENVRDILLPQDISWLFRLPQYITAYFDKFHPIFPALHGPTIDMAVTKEPLLQAVACIGAVCHSPSSDHEVSMALFDAGYKFLDQYTREDRSRFREIWVIQAFVLFEYFAIYSCREDLFPKALSIHRNLVDAAREYQMFQDGATLSGGSPGIDLDRMDDPLSGFTASSSMPDAEEKQWGAFVEQESQKRIIYSLYYLDSQLAISCNIRPLLSALELKYELPCPDNIWAAPTANAWGILLQMQSSSLSMNEEDDDDGNPDPRPAHGDLYECLMHLMYPNRTVGQQPLGFLWYSPFASLMLIIQMQMMIRDLTVASIFFYTNLRMSSHSDTTRHNLSIISEENRAQLFQALHSLSDLIPKVRTLSFLDNASTFGLDQNLQSNNGSKSLWHSVWIAWHYTAITLTHHDALLTTGIVEYGLPTALSTFWELGKPRAKHQRDVYSDRDVTRIVDNLEQLIGLMNRPPTVPSSRNGLPPHFQEDPFITLLGFKASMIGWRVVRLMTLNTERAELFGELDRKPSIFTAFSQLALARLMEAIGSPLSGVEGQDEHQMLGFDPTTSYDGRYLSWTTKTFSLRDTWPSGAWMVAVFQETQREVTRHPSPQGLN
ncbi:hypothetical protein G7046_g1240 [Stylonectria norvegica]|nr:hypothetical protein G7046_g1240 [Stylonectria norvegica]